MKNYYTTAIPASLTLLFILVFSVTVIAQNAGTKPVRDNYVPSDYHHSEKKEMLSEVREDKPPAYPNHAKRLKGADGNSGGKNQTSSERKPLLVNSRELSQARLSENPEM